MGYRCPTVKFSFSPGFKIETRGFRSKDGKNDEPMEFYNKDYEATEITEMFLDYLISVYSYQTRPLSIKWQKNFPVGTGKSLILNMRLAKRVSTLEDQVRSAQSLAKDIVTSLTLTRNRY